MQIVYAQRAVKDFRKLAPHLQQRIIAKIDFYASQPDPLQFAEKLVNNPYGDIRFRVGDYRVICDIARDTIKIIAIGHRRDIYR